MALFESHPDRKIMHEERLASSWSTVMPEGAGKGEKYLEEIERALLAFGFPEGTTKRQELMTKDVHGTKHNATRVCLYMEREGFRIYFSTQDYGRHLILSQLIEREPDIVKDMPRVYSAFQKEEVGACFSFVNAARTGAVEKLAKELNQDMSKINMEGKGGIVDIA